MKKTWTRVLSLVMAAIMLLTVVMLVSCSDDDTPKNPDNPDTPSNSGTDPDTPSNTTDPNDKETFNVRSALEALPACTFAGEEFLIIASSTYSGVFSIDQFPMYDEKTGALVQDALFERDAMVEEVLGITLAYDDTLDGAMFGKIGNLVRSGDDVYSLVLGTLAHCAFNMQEGGLLYNLNEVPHIDLTQPWWNKNSVNNFEINDIIYMATGAITNRYVYAPYAMLFNQKLLDDASLESPYILMDRDEWTIETLSEMIEDTYRDLNANDTVDVDDFYGLAPSADSETAYYFACGGRLLSKDENDELYFSYLDDANTAILDEVINIYASDDVLHYKETYDSLDAFRDGRAIFHSTALCDMTMLNNMTDKYGIVPMPKYDSYQTEWYSNANRFISTMALLPSSITDIQNVGLIVEALAMASQYTSLDKQYEQVLLNRQALDAQSKASLMIVVESTTYDLCYAFDMASMATSLRNNVIKVGKPYGSFYAAYASSLPAALDKFLSRFE